MKRLSGCVALTLVALGWGLRAQTSGVDAAFQRFWSARDRTEAAAAVDAVVRSGASPGDAISRLRRGRTYSTDAPRGVVRASHRTGATEFAYSIDVPASYTPTRKYQVRVQLHGGISRPDPSARGTGAIGALAGAEQIYVLPTAWAEAPWWSDAQIDNLRFILDDVKRRYNVDENRIVLSGVSDGGTSAYYVAMRDTTPFASFLPLNGYIMILANPSLALREGIYPNNLLDKPFFIVNGGKDPLYPTEIVDPYIEHFKRGGVELAYLPQPDGVHNTAWWPQVKEPFEQFVSAHPRDPLPAKLTWTTDGNALTSRAHWLVIDRLRAPRVQAPLADLNERVMGATLNFGVRTNGMRVTTVIPETNAARLGLLPGDLVQAVNGRQLPAALNLLEFLAISDPGTPLTLSVQRDGKTIDLTGTYQPSQLPRISPLFADNPPAGRVDLVRTGNTVRATTRGVEQFTLLLSPDAFNFSEPVTVIVDDKTVFSDRVSLSLATLMKWAANDNDRTMLFTAELRITVP